MHGPLHASCGIRGDGRDGWKRAFYYFAPFVLLLTRAGNFSVDKLNKLHFYEIPYILAPRARPVIDSAKLHLGSRA